MALSRLWLALFALLVLWLVEPCEAARRLRRPPSSSGSSGEEGEGEETSSSSPEGVGGRRGRQRGRGVATARGRGSGAPLPAASRRRASSPSETYPRPWMRFALSEADLRELRMMKELDREIELARRQDESLARIRRAALLPSAEAELSAFDRMIREEREPGRPELRPPFLPFFITHPDEGEGATSTAEGTERAAATETAAGPADTSSEEVPSPRRSARLASPPAGGRGHVVVVFVRRCGDPPYSGSSCRGQGCSAGVNVVAPNAGPLRD